MKNSHPIVIVFVLYFFCGFAQQTQYVDFKTAKAAIVLYPETKHIEGRITYTFDVLKPLDSLFLDAKNISSYKASLNQSDSIATYRSDGKLWVKHSLNPSKGNVLDIQFNTQPKKALYFLKRKEDWNIWTQGQGKYTSNWLPSFDDVNEKVIFDLSITFNKDYTVLVNGRLDSIQKKGQQNTWHYSMKHPMSSYLVAMAIGKYSKQQDISKSGIPLEHYYFTEDSLKFEPTYRHSKEIFDVLESEIGVPYPWDVYRQAPAYDFLYAGMENTSLTIFSEEFMVNDIAFNDKNYININAHELAHQWFGNLVTAKSGKHHWLQEGFATYYALLVERYLFGDDYYFFNLYKTAQDLIRQDMAGEGTSLLNPKSSSLTFYQRGAWVLHALRQKVGDNVFKKSVSNYLEQHKYRSATTIDFIDIVSKFYGKSLTGFVNTWIKSKTFPYEAALRLIHGQSAYLQEYVEIDCEVSSSKCGNYLKYYASEDAKAKVIAQQPSLVNADTFQNPLKVRQAIASYVNYVPTSLKEHYETLLDDPSYTTIENALYNLWTSFPLERSKYLSKTRNIHGFQDKNIRVLWLVLHLNTPEYKADGKDAIFAELLNYTYNHHPAYLRMKAFDFLKLMNACNDVCKANLKEAKAHHNWRMVSYAKKILAQLENSKE